ncbi:hypothetical protein ACFQ1R_08990 [Mariniflexile jejuense]|uniref:DUF3575 domain-containing protein n=1 Tax=Mariniflexile jejuense TaxID=1173582 RepID=A0ABW3JK51_9FLAO
MKKLPLITLIFSLISIISFSQETETQISEKENFNELKLNGLFLIAGSFEVTYERTINEESGVGFSVFLPFDEEVKDDVNYYISPYYRFYFGKKYAAGFFIEGFGMLNSVNEFIFNSNLNDFEKKSITDFALGIGVGGKWVTNNGFVGELNLGFGRNLFNDYSNTDLKFVGKIGITLGYRF